MASEFKKWGYWVRALVRNPQKPAHIGQLLEPAVIDKADDVFVGEVAKTDTLQGLCDDINIVFSSIGITRQKDKLTHRDIDYQGNRNILDIALARSVKKFIYVSAFDAHLYEHLEIIKDHEDFVRYLKTAGWNTPLFVQQAIFQT